jgi:very-short-patch-repair endonuclease
MFIKGAIGTLSELSAASLGVFRGGAAVEAKVTRKQLAALSAAGVIVRDLPDVYRMTVVTRSAEQRLRAALLWAGHAAAGAGLSAGEHYALEGVRARAPEIVVPVANNMRSKHVVVHRTNDRAPLMVRMHRGLPITGVEATLVALAHALDGEALEIACEDARRRGLTGVPQLRAYLAKFGRRGLPGLAATRALLDELDPRHPSRSTLEVKTRRLLVAHGITDFRRELPLEWNGRRYQYDFAFESTRTILETNGRRWHDDPSDFEHDNEKWSVPGHHGYRVVFATWNDVAKHPDRFLADLAATRGA